MSRRYNCGDETGDCASAQGSVGMRARVQSKFLYTTYCINFFKKIVKTFRFKEVCIF